MLSSKTISPTNSPKPFGGVLLYVFNLFCVDTIAVNTLSLLTLLLIFVAVPYSSINNLFILDNCSLDGILREIILVPFHLASLSCFNNFFILKISISLKTIGFMGKILFPYQKYFIYKNYI